MAKFPVEMNDDEGQTDAINYLLSGPSGLGQNFAGFSSYQPAWLTGNFRIPFTNPVYVNKPCDGERSSTTLKVYPNTNGIEVGMNVIGPDIPLGTTVVSIGSPTSTYTPITISGTLFRKITNVTISFGPLQTSNLYVAPINLGVSEMLDGRTWKFFFASTQASPPFSLGSGIDIAGVADDYYDGGYSPIGVVECTTDYVIVRTTRTFSIVAPSSGGTASYDVTRGGGNPAPFYNSTDCDARVTTTGATDRVFISGQLDNTVSYEVLDGAPATLRVYVAINRYEGVINNDPTNPDFIFDLDETVALKTYEFTGLSGTGTLDLIETVFTTVLDQPNPGYYRYILEVSFNSMEGDVVATSSEFGLRSLSSQVVKQ